MADKLQSDPHFKGAYARSLRMLLYENAKKPQHLRNNYCKRELLTTPIAVYTKKNFYLLHALNQKLEMLKSGGFIDYWQHQFSNEAKSAKVQQQRASTLELHQLLGCFQLLLVGCALSFLTFIFERVFHRYFEAKW